MADYPEDRRYHAAHGWAKLDGDVATFGISDHAQAALGNIVHFEPPAADHEIVAGRSYGELESVKAVSDLVAPLGGTVVEVNEAVVGAPEQVNDQPYATWLVRVRVPDSAQYDQLLDADGYLASLR